ncbi:hypothetical protein MLD38_013733 [Melastoma candidum]|uniref:Uncharacterized protein n=1 Tax=Melastoma candidum TaxID=119954 RepID=A0ACB9RE75_9MYRT|nr:hypothetical protein MLD38_013733 [Melastoma candidum]
MKRRAGNSDLVTIIFMEERSTTTTTLLVVVIGDGDGSHCPTDWKHDVFVSFRGKELRTNFASHFFNALENSGLDCYRDNDVREIGEKIPPKLVVAIRSSRFSIALFSRKYGGSKWCLNELVEMLDFHKKNKHHGHVFMPIFYKVKTGDVKQQTGKFGRCFEKYCEEICADSSQIETWRSALREAGFTTGWRLDEWKSEAEFIDKIVDQLSKNIHCLRSPYLPKDVVPIKSQVEEVISLLELSPTRCESPARVVGIYGNRGMGKTTLAGMVYKRVHIGFEGFSFLQLDDNANWDNLVHLQRKLLLDVFKVNSQQFHDLRSNADEIKKKFQGRKLLLVLDNVTSKDQVRHFGVDGRGHWLSGGSRVIITTKHRHLLDDLNVDEKYEVTMCRRDSLQMFSRHVFGSDHPHEGFEELCESVLDISNIRPSDLVDLASLLKGMGKERWSEGIEKWRKKRKVLCRDLVERVLLQRPISRSYVSGSEAGYPIHNAGRMAFLLNPFCNFMNNVSGAQNGLAALLILPEGPVFTIPLPNLDKVIDALPESQVERIMPAKYREAWMADKSMRRNDRRNTIQAWVSLLKRMGIVETQTEAARRTWKQINEASPSRFTEEVEDPSNIPQLVQNPLPSREDRPATDPNLQVEDVLNETKHMLLSEKVDPTPEAESISTSAIDREYVPRVYARDDAAYPSPSQAPHIETPGRVTPSDKDEDMDEGALQEDFEPMPSCGFSLSVFLSQISQAAGLHLSLGFENQAPELPTVTTSQPRRTSSMEKWRVEAASRNTASASAHQSTVDS